MECFNHEDLFISRLRAYPSVDIMGCHVLRLWRQSLALCDRGYYNDRNLACISPLSRDFQDHAKGNNQIKRACQEMIARDP